MPVTNFQKELVKLLAVNRSVDSHLAGGAALHFGPNSIRYSNDLDYFHDSEIRVASAFSQDQELLLKNKYELDVEIHQPGYIRAVVKKKNESTKVDWAHDSAWRFMPVEYFDDRGFCLHSIDLAINKTLALAGRDEPRDYLDVHDIDKRILKLGYLCWAACGKDPGFSPRSLLELLKRRGKYREEDFKRLKLNIKIDLIKLKTDWLKMLEEAETTINMLPATDVGCLYYSSIEKKFVNTCEGASPHFGKMGGVIPQIVESVP